MASTSDLQIWQNAVNGINELGKIELTSEEWSALAVLNGCLSSGNFQSDESRCSIKLIREHFNMHSNNPILQTHLQNFIALCEQYGSTANAQTTPPTANPIVQLSRTATNAGSSKKGSNRNLMLIVVAIIVGYLVYANWSIVNEVLGLKSEQTKIVAATLTTDPGLVINGVKWATRNVDAPGTFTAAPESAGMFYQWNRKMGWSSNDPLVNSDGGTEWNRTIPEGTEWEAVNDPSPAGWRVPTVEEFKTLLDTIKVYSEATSQNGVKGIRFTDKATGNNIFLPNAGYRYPKIECGTTLISVGNYGYYWSSSQDFRDKYGKERHFKKFAYFLEVFGNIAYTYSDWGGDRIRGFSVRSVAKNKDEPVVEGSHENVTDVDYNKNNVNYSQKLPPVVEEEIEVLRPNIQLPVQQTQNTNSSIPGRFPEASERLLTASDLQYLSKEDLKIMRNEIFARHGYIFQTQAMKTYFQNQSWYSPQRSDVTAILSNIEIKNVNLIKSYENNATESVSIKGVPPIENTGKYANASILLPKNWDGTFILANGFVWIDSEDKKTQRKYGIFPNGDNFYDDHETWDDDDRFYEYPLSPNVVIEAGIWSKNNSTFKTRRMTVNEFANYMRGLGWGVEGESENAYGIVANVTYNNGTITKIVEKYTP